MKPTLHRLEPAAVCVGCGVGRGWQGGGFAAWLGSRLARRGLRFEGVAINPVLPGIAVHQSS